MSDSATSATSADLAYALEESVNDVNRFTPYMNWHVPVHLQFISKCTKAAPTSVQALKALGYKSTLYRCAQKHWHKKEQLLSMAWRGLEATGTHSDAHAGLRAQAICHFFGFLAAFYNADRTVARWADWATWLAQTFVEACSDGLLGKDVVFMALVSAMSTHYSDPTDLAQLNVSTKDDILSVLDNPPCALTDENTAAVGKLRGLLANA